MKIWNYLAPKSAATISERIVVVRKVFCHVVSSASPPRPAPASSIFLWMKFLRTALGKGELRAFICSHWDKLTKREKKEIHYISLGGLSSAFVKRVFLAASKKWQKKKKRQNAKKLPQLLSAICCRLHRSGARTHPWVSCLHPTCQTFDGINKVHELRNNAKESARAILLEMLIYLCNIYGVLKICEGFLQWKFRAIVLGTFLLLHYFYAV